MENLAELFRTYSKHMGDDADADIAKACEELVDLCERTFTAACARELTASIGRVHFTGKLKKAAAYAGWKPAAR